MTFVRALAAAAAVTALAAAGAAAAQDFQPKTAGDWKVDLRLTNVAPTGDYPILTAANAATGLRADAEYDVMPTLGVTYFFTDKIALEVIAGTTQHEIRAKGPGTDVLVHETYVLPPVVSLQYHPLPAAKVSPYVGAGVNYMLFYSGEDKNGFEVDLDNGFGYALQAGVDVALKGPYSLNVDVKKIFFETDASINDGALKAAVDLDPWVVSIGVGRRF